MSARTAVERLSWANTVLFPPAVAKRLLERTRGQSNGTEAEPDLWQPPGPLNAVLRGLLALETSLVARFGLPWGLSVIAVARKPTA